MERIIALFKNLKILFIFNLKIESTFLKKLLNSPQLEAMAEAY